MLDDDCISPMEKFEGTTIDITIKNHHTWGCPVYVFHEILQGNISGLTRREPHSNAGIYLGNSKFHAVSVALVLKPATGHVSPQLNVVFDDDFSTVLFMREDTIPPNCTDIVQRRSQSVALENIDLEDNWFTSDLEEYPIKPPSHKLSLSPDNNINTLTPLQFVPHVQESPAREGVYVSEVINCPGYEGVRNTSNLNNICFSQQ